MVRSENSTSLGLVDDDLAELWLEQTLIQMNSFSRGTLFFYAFTFEGQLLDIEKLVAH